MISAADHPGVEVHRIVDGVVKGAIDAPVMDKIIKIAASAAAEKLKEKPKVIKPKAIELRAISRIVVTSSKIMTTSLQMTTRMPKPKMRRVKINRPRPLAIEIDGAGADAQVHPVKMVIVTKASKPPDNLRLRAMISSLKPRLQKETIIRSRQNR